VAEAAVLADVSVALCLLGWLLPFPWIFLAAAVTPMAVVAVRNRPRAVLAGGIAGVTVGFLIAGSGLAGNVAGCAILGTFLGTAWRRQWGISRTVGVALAVLWPPASALALAALTIFSSMRKLVLDQFTNSWSGISRTLNDLGLNGISRTFSPVFHWSVVHWWASIPIILFLGTAGATWTSWALAWPALRRLAAAGLAVPHDDDLALSSGTPTDLDEPPAPLPVELRGVTHWYPGASAPALVDVSLTVEPGQFVAVIGPNGSGKSTLTRLLGGRQPTSGQVIRPGRVGPGRPGGIATIFQRPESQVLGVRVRDDVVWGLPADHHVDVAAVLARVGLADLIDRETSTLSGGELQRLAVAAALARRPALLLSDESTAMVDADGRRLLTDLFARLAAEEGLAVVHVTHRPEEAARADHAFALDRGHLLDQPSPAVALTSLRPLPSRPLRPCGDPVLQLEGVGHVYSPRSPWSHRALTDIDLTISEGEGVLVVGHNGSGKSTLAWILAGLLVPTEGQALLDGRPVDGCVGQVALSFQHARLQLLRNKVGSDIRAAAGVGPQEAAAALELVGLDPAEFAGRAIDQLSGGQQRRVALAGLLARHPRVLVLDEPFAGLDDASRVVLIEVLDRLRAETRLTVVVISHDLEGADRLAERVIILRDGQVVDDGRTAELDQTVRLDEAGKRSVPALGEAAVEAGGTP
jgi:energy-coupling factor transport system ATP-binding protein